MAVPTVRSTGSSGRERAILGLPLAYSAVRRSGRAYSWSVAGGARTVLLGLRLFLTRFLLFLRSALVSLRYHLAGHRVDLHFLHSGLLRNPDVERVDELSVLALQLMLHDLAARDLGKRRGARLLERNLGTGGARVVLRDGHRRICDRDGEGGDDEEHERLLGTIHGDSPSGAVLLSTPPQGYAMREARNAASSSRRGKR